MSRKATAPQFVSSESSRELFRQLLEYRRPTLDLEEIGVFKLIDELDRVRKLWKFAEESKQTLEVEYKNAEQKLGEVKKKYVALELEIKETRTHMRTLMEENKALRLDLNIYETREKQLKSAVKNGLFDTMTKAERDQLAFLRDPVQRTHSKRLAARNPNLAIEEVQEESETIDYDDTGDSLDEGDEEEVIVLRNGREYRRSSAAGRNRRSVSAQPAANAANKRSRSRVMAAPIDEEPTEAIPPKRSRDEDKKEELITTTTTTTTVQAAMGGVSKVGRNPRTSDSRRVHRSVTRRSMSVDSMPAATPSLANPYGLFTPYTKSTLDMRSARTPMSTWTNDTGSRMSSRTHTFEESSGMRFTKCAVCKSPIISLTTRAWRCSDCHQEVHKACSSRLQLPCIPRQKNALTPKSATRNGKKCDYRLRDYCPDKPPMMSYIIVHLVIVIEKKGVETEGLYRVPGSTRAVTNLLNELLSQNLPNLMLQDTEVLTETLKRFLRELRDPLVPRTSREEFVVAASQYATDQDKGIRALNKVICELPQPNRDTMAYLFLHWKKVIAAADMNKMPRENMARVLSPCVMGPPMHKIDQMQAANQDVTNCERTLNALFAFDNTYWERFLTPYKTNIENIENIRADRSYNRSMLGPVSESPSSPKRSGYRKPTRNFLGPIQD